MDLDLLLGILFVLVSAAGLGACIIGCIWLCPWLSTYFAKLRQYRALCNDLAYPYFVRSFDVSRKRNPLMEDYIDQFLIDGGYIQILQHDRYLLEWKARCRQRIEGSPDWLKDRANQLFYANLDDAHAYQFYLRRNQTRYRQVNYRKIPYTVSQEAEHFFCDLPYLENRNMKLKEIGYECTLHDYFVKDQRRLMTKDLRKQIMIIIPASTVGNICRMRWGLPLTISGRFPKAGRRSLPTFRCCVPSAMDGNRTNRKRTAFHRLFFLCLRSRKPGCRQRISARGRYGLHTR